MKYFIISIIAAIIFPALSQAQGSQNISLLHNWSDPTLPASSAHNNTYNEVWGYNANGKEYAIIGSTFGTHFFNVTNPNSVNLIQTVQGAATGTNIIHRDYHDYAGYLYMVCDEGQSSLQIVDLSYLPDSVHKVYDSSSLFRRAHNIYIDTTNALMYACGVYSVARGYVGFEVYSLANPLLPQLVYYTNNYGTVHDVYVRNNIAYLNAGYDKLAVVNFANPSVPVTLGTLTSYPYSGYNHSGWLSDDGTKYAFADETHGMNIKLADVTDLNDIKILSTFTSGVTSNSIPHNLMIKGDYVYVSYYFDGLYIFSIADPLNPVMVGFFDTSTLVNNGTYKGAWGVYSYLPSGNVLVSDMQNGLFVFDVSPALVGIEQTITHSDLNIFPNPAGSVITINRGNKGFSAETILKVYDMNGRIVRTETIHAGTSELRYEANLTPGIYALSIISNGTIETKRLIVR